MLIRATSLSNNHTLSCYYRGDKFFKMNEKIHENARYFLLSSRHLFRACDNNATRLWRARVKAPRGRSNVSITSAACLISDSALRENTTSRHVDNTPAPLRSVCSNSWQRIPRACDFLRAACRRRSFCAVVIDACAAFGRGSSGLGLHSMKVSMSEKVAENWYWEYMGGMRIYWINFKNHYRIIM